MSEHIETLQRLLDEGGAVGKGPYIPTKDRPAIEAAIEALSRTPQPVTHAGGEVAMRVRVSHNSGVAHVDILSLHTSVTDGEHEFYTHPPVADAALVRDAERYRWLCECKHINWMAVLGPDVCDNGIDAAIDAALNQRGGGV